MTRIDLTATNGAIELAGSIWLPVNAEPNRLVLMHPGSGPSDRDNDVFFPPIRQALLDTGAAVASFDKRGVGASTGSWLEASIEDQADDLLASLRAVRQEVPDIPTGLFGHSQGGWVVLDAAARAAVDFVVTSSGPAVTPRVQEEFSTRNRLVGNDDVEQILGSYGELFDRLSAGDSFDRVAEWMGEPSRSASFVALESVGAFVPDGPVLWDFARLILDYDPAPALTALSVPLLALLGSADTVVPVELSADVFRERVRPDLLTLRIIEGGDHRMQFPHSDDFVPGYLPTLVEFVLGVAR
ncbi:MAG: alpha/beta hydrolase [Rhodoglobus sp.]